MLLHTLLPIMCKCENIEYTERRKFISTNELLECIEYRTYIQIIFVEIDTVIQDKHSVKQA